MKSLIWAILLAAPFAAAQASASWVRTEKTEPFSGNTYSEFTLEGKYLTSPQHGDGQPPMLIVDCKANENGKVYRGSFISGHLRTGTVLAGGVGLTPVLLRLNDGKAQGDYWSPSTDGTALFFGSPTIANLLYGHILPHKENTSPPITKVLVASSEAFAADMVIQFDMPEPTELADACGQIFHKRK